MELDLSPRSSTPQTITLLIVLQFYFSFVSSVSMRCRFVSLCVSKLLSCEDYVL